MSHEKFPISIVVFPESAEVRTMLRAWPNVQAMLFSSGIPQRFLNPALYTAAEELNIVQIPPRSHLIQFGRASQFSDGLFIDPSTGEVVECAYGTIRWFVNSSLEQFARTVIAVTERFPFMSKDAGYEKRKTVSDELGAIIHEIDPLAMEEEGFWSTFVDDVAIGDYTTEMVLNWET